ncbi:MAG TPA: PSP1 C-terminal domain-containing protein [Gemmatales bacterium]|nr:PSP1 C-terminal domain-containing protein [Gemmatales bacterium]
MIVLKASKGLLTVPTSSISQEMYLISYGACGTLGCFIAPEQTVQYPRGSQVMVRTERGKETGTVLCLASSHALPSGLQLHPGQILGYCQQQDESEQKRLNSLGQEVFSTAAQLMKELFLPIRLIDVEKVSDPDTFVLYVLQFGKVELKALQTELTKRCQVQVMIHDVTNLEALEEAAETGCGSCGNECGEGGCGSGACGSCGSADSPQKFQDDWQKYFAELRQEMERRHE